MTTAPRGSKWFPFGLALSDEILRRAAWTEAPEGAPAVAGVRTLVDGVNAETGTLHSTGRPALRAGQVLTAGLLTEALRVIWDFYAEAESGAMAASRHQAAERLGPEVARRCAASFVGRYPPAPVRAGLADPSGFLDAEDAGHTGRARSEREMVLLHLTIENPAMEPLRALFDDEPLARRVPYRVLVALLEERMAQAPPVPRIGMPLMVALRAPMRAHPDSLEAQLAYIRERWSALLPRDLLDRMTLAMDILAEEQQHRGEGPGPVQVMEFHAAGGADDPEEERFSADADWMSNVVLMAKSTYVWLDQLARKYGREVSRLDQIPDEELDTLARWGFTGLWLIGLWERSPASRNLKRACGNPEAESSAYSLVDYAIAADLGGEDAYRNLKDRAWARGVRLAADMVPNHTGLDSRWMVEHPDRFLQVDTPPYPGYRFSCDDLCEHPDITVQVEDGYWEKRDAAVVFKHTDQRDGRVRYVYHGNDGTSMPWNDTAQLDYLQAETREAVIQKILHVARRFPVIRFDAAMTLAKKHIQRLWYPRPGDAGAIPSRAEHGMSKEEFDRHVPVEFWREVVDRVAAEAPDTLLLAEAFWLMEGYFVRTLGMHRVYNSAFMNMLKMEENSKYRATIRNVLEFSPEVLKRFVNFMNNPDERTAVEQFGKGDKYIGCALLMVTLPGLPMWGHGQVEGFTEKYGMEYRRAYWDEQVDQDLVRRHEAEVFPLMRLRHLFSGAEHFALYDFVQGDGDVDENVFAYSNRAGEDRALILYNNAFQESAGTIHTSCAVNTAAGGAQHLVRRSLVEALALPSGAADLVTFRDHRTGLRYLRSCHSLAEHGFYAMLGGYQHQAFVDFRVLHDAADEWLRLEAHLGGGGVPDLDRALEELRLAPLLEAWRDLLAATPGDELLFVAAAVIAALVQDDTEGLLADLLQRELPDGPLALALSVCAALPEDTLRTGTTMAGALFDTPATRRYLQINEHDGVEYLNAEAFETLVTAWIAFSESLPEVPAEPAGAGPAAAEPVDAAALLAIAAEAGYRIDRLRSLLEERSSTT